MPKPKVNKPPAVPRDRQVPPKPVKPQSKKAVSEAITIVGIGASAGGLAALQALFSHMSAQTGMAFVVVTHMHPEHESHLAGLLQSHTSMPVEQVNEKIPVKSDHVYVMPPSRQVLVTDSHLDLGDFDEPRGHRTPIDGFFRSLAAAQAGAIGVILSGSGTDGSVGIKDIKENGGLLLVQNPDEAEYDGMPRAAIGTGLVDLALPVAQLAEKLVQYSQKQPVLPHDPDDLTDGQQATVDRILAQVHVHTGNDFSQYKRATILRRLHRRMQLSGSRSPEAYLDFIRQQPAEAAALFNDILIGVTNFFRDRPSWSALAKTVVPALFENKTSDAGVRVWSIGCATGEEAYGLGMLLLEHASTLDRHVPIQVFASDLAEGSLSHAREGLFPAAIEADVSPERLERFFLQEGNHYRVKRELRDIVLFTNHNVLRDPPFSHVDLVVCRNLLIYLRREVQDSIFEIFHYALNPGGFLFLGNSESADSVASLFANVNKTHRIFRAKAWRGSQVHLPSLPLSLHTRTSQDALPVRALDDRMRPRKSPNFLVEHVVALEHHTPPSLLVDEQYNILHVSDTAGRFLEQRKGTPTRELLESVRRELQADLQTALFQALEHSQRVLTDPIWVRFNGFSHRVVVAVEPFRAESKSSETQLLVSFLEDESTQPSNAPAKKAPAAGGKSGLAIAQLQAEVRRLQEQLQARVREYNNSNEEMKAANEELQSINEEYRSTSEELETSREELQSINEELQTVNNELKSKFDEITRSNSDLENLMAASEIATLFLDRDLRIKRFTAGMDQVLDLLPSDYGRPVAHLANKLGYNGLVEDAEKVLRRLVILERELQSKSGGWYLVRLRPYHTLDHKIDGLVITFVDVTELKQTQQALQEANRALQARVEKRTGELMIASQSLLSADKLFTTLFQSNPVPTALNRLADWTFINVNQAYLEYFNARLEDVIGGSAVEFDFAPDADLREELRKRLLHDGQVRHLELTRSMPSGERRTVLASMQVIEVEGEQRVISSFIDITDRVKAEQQIRTLASDLTLAEQRERHRISQVLHDELQQRLFALRMQLTFLREETDGENLEKLKAELPQLETGIAEAIEITRNLSIELSPVILRGEGLAEALRWLGGRMEEKLGLKVKVQADDGGIALSETLRVLVYQSVHELLFNIVKHAGVLEAEVIMQHVPGFLRVSVRDHGAGFDVSRARAHAMDTHGLLNTQNKLMLLGCTMQVNSVPGQGTEIVIEIPIPGAED